MAAMGKQVLDAGGTIIEIVGGNSTGGTPTRADLDAWINTYGLTVTSVIDAPGANPTSLHALVQREYTFIVDLSTMKIVQFFPGTTTGFGTTGAMSGMQAMLQLLGPKGG